MKIIIKTYKKEKLTAGVRKYLKKINVWYCDIILTKNNGEKTIIKSIEFMSPQNTKKEALKEANKYKEYILSKGNFYFS